jgi:hypothetical protein
MRGHKYISASNCLWGLFRGLAEMKPSTKAFLGGVAIVLVLVIVFVVWQRPVNAF